MPDQWRASAAGYAGDRTVRTPNIDALAAEGTVYDSAYCQAPLCMPSRASLLTERYVRDHGVADNSTEIPTGAPTFVSALRDAGYETACIGKMHLWVHDRTGLDARDRAALMRGFGFDHVDEVVGKMASTRILTDYTRHLQRAGIEDQFLAFMAPRTSGGTPYREVAEAQVKVPVWNTDPCPLPEADHLDSYVGRRAVDWIEARQRDDPFFLWVGFPGPHDPWDAPMGQVEPYLRAAVEPPRTGRPELPAAGPLRRLLEERLAKAGVPAEQQAEVVADVRRHYYANCSLIDGWVGKLFAALRRRGLLESTWIIFTSDHGEMLGEHGLFTKMVFYEDAVRVPLIVRPPDGVKRGRVQDLVELIDVAATIRDITGAGAVPDSSAQSLVAAGARARGVVHAEYAGFTMLRTASWKVLVHGDSGVPVQLFDLEADPDETVNLVDLPGQSERLHALRRELIDPYLAGSESSS